jgi:hypothetical protein
MIGRSRDILVAILQICAVLSIVLAATPATAGEKVPVIYSTDLYHPHQDADDHFDIATLLAMEEIDLLGVVLDNAGPSQEERPGTIPLKQLERISGRKIPAAIGLRRPLRSPDDKALDQEARYQGGVEMILKGLRASPVPVALVFVGSVRDAAAAFNRDPDLLRAKASTLLIFIGDAAEEHSNREYNVEIDVHAFARVLGSGLPVRWVPCWDGGAPKNRGHASFWVAPRKDTLEGCSPEVLQYFIYCFRQSRADPLEFLRSPPSAEDRAFILSGAKEMWCTAIFTGLTSRKTWTDGKVFRAVPEGTKPPEGFSRKDVFRFTQVELTVDAAGKVRYGPGPGAHRLERFEIAIEPGRYGEAMTSLTNGLLRELGKK